MDTIGELLNPIADGIRDLVVTMVGRFISETSYREGFGACFLSLVVLGGLSSAFSWAWGLVQKFFKATKSPPAPGAGPTPVGITGGCVQGGLVLFVLAIVVLYMLSRLVLP